MPKLLSSGYTAHTRTMDMLRKQMMPMPSFKILMQVSYLPAGVANSRSSSSMSKSDSWLQVASELDREMKWFLSGVVCCLLMIGDLCQNHHWYSTVQVCQKKISEVIRAGPLRSRNKTFVGSRRPQRL